MHLWLLFLCFFKKNFHFSFLQTTFVCFFVQDVRNSLGWNDSNSNNNNIKLIIMLISFHLSVVKRKKKGTTSGSGLEKYIYIFYVFLNRESSWVLNKDWINDFTYCTHYLFFSISQKTNKQTKNPGGAIRLCVIPFVYYTTTAARGRQSETKTQQNSGHWMFQNELRAGRDPRSTAWMTKEFLFPHLFLGKMFC